MITVGDIATNDPQLTLPAYHLIYALTILTLLLLQCHVLIDLFHKYSHLL